ncbi:MAG: hypothetical protein Q8J78_09195 [Moraxellaceae bacterium]|nr:hypothetical protein [Moraxellaceae bacterium]
MAIDDKVVTSNELTTSLIDAQIAAFQSFKVVAVADISKVVTEIEGRIEKAGLTCRVFTEYRSTALVGSFWGPTALLGVAAGIGMAAHNLATFNPDYEIGKNKLAGTITVTYKRSLS